MPFYIVRNDITRMEVDAVVNAANNSLLPGGGVCGAIFEAAGYDELSKECKKIGYCRTGEAVITGGYNLPAGHIIHTPGPVWHGGQEGEDRLLESSYVNSMKLAVEKGLASIAFPLISSGIYGFPKERAFGIASKAIKEFISDNDLTVYLVLYDTPSYIVGRKHYPGIKEYISERYIPTTGYKREGLLRETEQRIECSAVFRANVKKQSIRDKVTESFRNMLFRLIDESGMSDPEVYRKANLDRRLFSKIRSNPDYSPSRETAIALGIALGLDYGKMQELIGRAGYALSRSLVFDVVIEFCLEKGIYDIHEINELLYEETGKCLGY